MALEVDLSAMTFGLAGAVKDAIKARFQKVFNDNNAFVAAITVSKFKLKWVETQSKKDLHKQLLQLDDESDVQSNVETEANDYLNNAKTIENLQHYPNVRKLFLLHNTALPSSAPVKQLLSLGRLVLTSKRNRLTDDRCEKLLLM